MPSIGSLWVGEEDGDGDSPRRECFGEGEGWLQGLLHSVGTLLLGDIGRGANRRGQLISSDPKWPVVRSSEWVAFLKRVP